MKPLRKAAKSKSNVVMVSPGAENGHRCSILLRLVSKCTAGEKDAGGYAEEVWRAIRAWGQSNRCKLAYRSSGSHGQRDTSYSSGIGWAKICEASP